MNDKLTKSDLKKMQDEVDYRILELRPKLLDEVKEMRAHGDLSENFEYYAAKKAKNQNESRIRYLEKMIKTAEVIDDSSMEDEIGINSVVTVFIEEDNLEETYKIVTTIRQDTLNNYISIDSPMGKALLKKKVGDRILIKVSDTYSYYVKVVSIDKTNGDEDDKISSY